MKRKYLVLFVFLISTAAFCEATLLEFRVSGRVAENTFVQPEYSEVLRSAYDGAAALVPGERLSFVIRVVVAGPLAPFFEGESGWAAQSVELVDGWVSPAPGVEDSSVYTVLERRGELLSLSTLSGPGTYDFDLGINLKSRESTFGILGVSSMNPEFVRYPRVDARVDRLVIPGVIEPVPDSGNFAVWGAGLLALVIATRRCLRGLPRDQGISRGK